MSVAKPKAKRYITKEDHQTGKESSQRVTPLFFVVPQHTTPTLPQSPSPDLAPLPLLLDMRTWLGLAPRLESFPQDTSVWLRRLSPSSSSPSSNPVPSGTTRLLHRVFSVSLGRMKSLLCESGARYLIWNVSCPLIWNLVSGQCL